MQTSDSHITHEMEMEIGLNKYIYTDGSEGKRSGTNPDHLSFVNCRYILKHKKNKDPKPFSCMNLKNPSSQCSTCVLGSLVFKDRDENNLQRITEFLNCLERSFQTLVEMRPFNIQ